MLRSPRPRRSRSILPICGDEGNYPFGESHFLNFTGHRAQIDQQTIHFRRPDAHAKFEAGLFRYCGVTGDHLPLQLDRTAHRVDDAGELGKEAVAGRLDDATAMLGDFSPLRAEFL
jgi:hypothetical protein